MGRKYNSESDWSKHGDPTPQYQVTHVINDKLSGKQAVEPRVQGTVARYIIDVVAIAGTRLFITGREAPVAGNGRVQQYVRGLSGDLRVVERLQYHGRTMRGF